jgi:hypothetical protein
MQIPISFFLLIIVCLACNPRTNCTYPINIKLYRVFPNDEFEIRVNGSDSTIFRKDYNKFFLIDASKPNEYLVKDYCDSKDSIKVHFIVNKRHDFTFFVNPKLVKNVYLGCDQTDSINVYFDYRDGKSDLTFD